MNDHQRKGRKEDIVAHLGDDYDRYLGAIVPPIFQNTLFTHKTMDHEHAYTRISNPTIEIAEQKIAALEGAEAGVLFSTGVAAMTAAVMHHLGQNDHAISVAAVYPRTRQLLKQYLQRFGVSVTFVNGLDISEFEQAIQPNTKLIYLESPSSLVFSLQDLAAVAKLARAKGITTMIDNTWSTPLYQNPLELGIDLVIHATTKYLGGHSDIMGGIIVGSKERIQKIAQVERELVGAVMDPHQAWLLIRSLRTMPVRMRQHQENALKVAEFLEGHDKVTRVFYPGLESHPQYELGRKQMSGYAGVMSFLLDAKPGQSKAFFRTLSMYEVGSSWGGFESLISVIVINEELSEATCLPVGTELYRISIGLEHVDSLIDDLAQGLAALE